MHPTHTLQTSLAAKITAIVLLLLLSAGAALGGVGIFLVSEGYGTADTFWEDWLCQGPMEQGMYMALYHATENGSQSHYEHRLITQYAGLACEVYDGEVADGRLVGTWGEIPAEPGVRSSLTSASGLAESGYYTVVGYLPQDLPRGELFYACSLLYQVLRPLSGGGVILLTLLLLFLACGLLGFLFWTAGHRRSAEGVLPNWQDRIPLDLYLTVVTPVFFFLAYCGIRLLDASGSSVPLMSITLALVCLLGAVLLVLAALMTLATRLKLGRWWRNTVCYRVLRWCWRLWKGLWTALADFVRILPFTWRAVLLVAGVLALQSVLVLLFSASYNGPFFLLLGLVLDAVVVAAAAWLSLQLQRLQEAGEALAAGNLSAKIDTDKMYWDIKVHAQHLNDIGAGMNRAVEQRMKSERLKTELITNVSHDIKTPLTSIVNYVDLIKKEDLPPTAAAYAAVLDRQAQRLKKLTEDLVEASKASTGNLAVELEPIVVNEIVHQAVGDYNERLTAGKLEVIVSTFEGNIIAMADGRLLWRVLDNLLGNVCKYALPGTRVYIDLGTREDTVFLAIKNISRDRLDLSGSADELTERFVRGDASRHTEGSGLGLNIARSLIELMGGAFGLSVDGDLFKVELSLRQS